MIKRMSKEVSGPLCKKNCDNDEQQELDVICDLHHDHRQGHGEPGYSSKEGNSPKKGKCSWIHPLPIGSSLNTKKINRNSAKYSTIQTPYQQHWYNQPTGDLCASCPAGKKEVEQEKDDKGSIVKLQMSIPREQVLDCMFSSYKKECCCLVV